MKVVKSPGPMRLLFGSALAYWLAGIANPAFVAIAVMIVLFIPLFFTDYSAVDYQLDLAHEPVDKPAPKPVKTREKPSSIQLLKDESGSADSS